jgi:hypothetical protein
VETTGLEELGLTVAEVEGVSEVSQSVDEAAGLEELGLTVRGVELGFTVAGAEELGLTVAGVEVGFTLTGVDEGVSEVSQSVEEATELEALPLGEAEEAGLLGETEGDTAAEEEGDTVPAGELGVTELEGVNEGVVLVTADDEGDTVDEAAGELVGVAELEGGTVEDLTGVELGLGVAVEETTGGAQLYRISLMCSV